MQPKQSDGMIRDGDNFLGASYGDLRYPMRIHDDGYGPLWIYLETLGPFGIVRAQTWEDAHTIVQDEIQDTATWEEIEDAADYLEPGWQERGELPEGYSFTSTSKIASEDLNGSALRLLTAEDLEAHGIVLEIEREATEPIEEVTQS